LSIIISETVDATDYYDGFGTGEVVIGIRAYQWGWEYFYPKNIDLNYNVKPSFSSFIGNSLKYNNASSEQLDAGVLWKFYQKKNKTAQLNTPAYTILSPNDANSSINAIDFSSVGNSISKDSNAFKKISRFSKISHNNISTNLDSNNVLFTKVNNLYLSPTNMNNDSYQYGSLRQHNLTSLNSTLPYFSSLVDSKSYKTFFDYTLNTTKTENNNVSQTNFFNQASTHKPLRVSSSNNSLLTLLSNEQGEGLNYFLRKFLLNFNTSYSFNSTLDGKSYNNFFLNYSSKNAKKLLNLKKTGQFMLTDDLTVTNKSNFYSWNIFNKSKHYRFIDLKSSNLQFLSPDKNLRSVVNKNLSGTNVDFTTQTNVSAFLTKNDKIQSSSYNFFKTSNSSWINQDLIKKSFSTNTTLSSTYNPLTSSNPEWNTLSYDKLNKYTHNDVPSILRGKEEVAPEFLFNTYWNSYYRNINLGNNYKTILTNIFNLRTLYLPSISEYSEYDFKNWQALESLEDTIWELSHSSFAQEEYMSLKKSALLSTYYDKIQVIYNTNLRTQENSKFKFKFKISYKSLVNNLTKFYSLPIYSEEIVSKPSNINLLNFNYFSNDALVDNLEDSYENIKNFKLLYFFNNKNTILPSTVYLTPTSFTKVLDAFRPDFDENNWNIDFENTSINSFSLPLQNNLNLTNPIKLRSTAKNSIVTYNAIQKVYKSRFDELRANINFSDFTNSFASYPFLIESKTPYENILKKNKESYYNMNFYTKTFSNNYSDILSIFLSLNTNFTDIPFLLSLKSDASRYLWFDWQSRWSSIEVQPSSIAKYSLAGLPYASKKFEYSTTLGDELSDSENYLTKISRARKNYLPNWAYSSYFYAKITNWFFYKNSLIFFSDLNTQNIKVLLKKTSFYWDGSVKSINNNTSLSTPSYSNLNRANTITWSPINGIASYYYATSILTDILTKREYLYRDFYKTKANSISLPKFLTVSSNNILLNEVKSSFNFIDPSSYSSEVTRELLYQNVNFLRYTFIKDFLKISNEVFYNVPINFNLLNNYFVYLFGYVENYNTIKGNSDLYKSQYRPMRKGITNMIRLQATNAIAMPTEIRLHILASSKDVIHSWAIPSAGIKIDCVPGFSSHRVAIFLQHGIFWGQCMEICGRYHHWMPIVVYFMKRDLFFLWCTHFMHYSDIDQSFNATDKQLIDFLKLVSFDKSTWTNELNSILN
jgi:heme/copper-type cytochrome/quinol oxidase subunit 2